MSSKAYEGSCHCGKISYTVTISPPLEEGHEVVTCNCSICIANGYLSIYPKVDAVVFHSGKDEATTYMFGDVCKHKFCPTCGTSVGIDFQNVEGSRLEGTKQVNVRTLKGVDLDTLKLKELDGKKF